MALRPLHDDWTLEAVSGPVPAEVAGRRIPATVPGVAHTDLLAAGMVTDPFDGDAEAAQQWIGDTVWRWRTTFEWHDDGSDRHDLVAEGLDTVARVELNGVVVAETENQHRSYRVDVRHALVDGDNSLVVTFAAPVPEVESRVERHGALPHVNHHPFTMLRKSASNYGWDWGVDVATSGIWRPIGLDSWSGVRIASVRPLVDVTDEGGVLDAHVELEWATPGAPAATGTSGTGSTGTDDTAAETEVTVLVDGRRASSAVAPGTTQVQLTVVVPGAELWWPRGHGAQPLYPVTVTVGGGADSGRETEQAPEPWEARVGFRTVSLDTAPDEHGAPFVLSVNGQPVQVRGANWIPDHAFLTEMTPERYRLRVADATDANMNLLRVWGGGVYESHDLYDACDEAGVLVWQDFLFACGAYAEEPWLADEVEAEAREAVTRLSRHASLVIWNGNNEAIWGYVDWDWRRQLAGRTWGEGYYFDLLPRVVAELDGTRPYSPGSPWSFGDYLHPNDAANGTMHIWDVWNRLDYTAYRDHEPRFVSEFGFQGPPAWSTLTSVVHDEPLDPYGHEMLVHQKAEDGNLKLERGLDGHLPAPSTIEDWHWATQLNQAAAIRFGIEHFRSLAPLNTGVVVWQLNDDWPVVSWAAVDFAGHRKPLWHVLRAVYEARLATIQPRASGLALVLLNDTDDPWSCTVTVAAVAFDGGRRDEVALPVTVEARGSTTVALPAALVDGLDPAAELLVADLPGFGAGRARWDAAEVVDQHLDPGAVEAVVALAETAPGVALVTVTARSYARDVTLLVDRVDPGAVVDTGMVTLLAGESATFRVTGVAESDAERLVADDVVRHAGDLQG
jgi:beta-mannosidase